MKNCEHRRARKLFLLTKFVDVDLKITVGLMEVPAAKLLREVAFFAPKNLNVGNAGKVDETFRFLRRLRDCEFIAVRYNSQNRSQTDEAICFLHLT